ncbi:MAG: CoA transferase [Pseudomonadales bacterium]|nr:CoA transferase [Pseudomonadales bacterium]MBO6563255.1 CoA transferase [Pseudomonadales bacterium]MBO6594592.1 CoA transferase [Pseudomonadales bacterium]MBO6655473.1 CoA transferase [Pseudomonadales bacterium]MBO6701095.1 CoA transferase [Pseudomonadales bacterium]
MTDLSGITIVTLEQAVAAPYVSGRLAEEGARVIKIERDEGDFARRYDSMVEGESAYFVWLNAGKESVTLNLREEADRQLLCNLLKEADVFIQNLAPGALARLGFAPESLRAEYPELIICSISGYGEDGPYKNQKAYDLLIQAESGLCSITGVGEELTRVGVSVSDISAGMTAYQEILLALFARARDPENQGRLINVSLYHSTADWMNVPYLQHRYGGFTPQNHGLKHPSIAPYGAFTCGDEKQVLFSIQNEREWLWLCRDVLGDERLATDARFADNEKRLENREALETLITKVFQRTDREDVIERLDSANIAYGRVSDLSDLAAHPQNRFRQIETENGTIEALGRGAEIEGKVKTKLKIPAIGAESERIREEFGK